jgi:hypothetical protein
LSEQEQWNRGELNPVAVLARHSSRPRAIPVVVGSEQWAVGSGQWRVGSGRCREPRPPCSSHCSLLTAHCSLLTLHCHSDPGGIRTHTPRGGRLSTDPGYRLQHEVIDSGPGGIRTLTPVTAPASETGVTTRFHHQAMCTIVAQLQTRELNPASRLMRPGRAPARLQSLVISHQSSVIRSCRGSVPSSLTTDN